MDETQRKFPEFCCRWPLWTLIIWQRKGRNCCQISVHWPSPSWAFFHRRDQRARKNSSSWWEREFLMSRLVSHVSSCKWRRLIRWILFPGGAWIWRIIISSGARSISTSSQTRWTTRRVHHERVFNCVWISAANRLWGRLAAGRDGEGNRDVRHERVSGDFLRS